jgi:predicted O-methyltransferase YrrM
MIQKIKEELILRLISNYKKIDGWLSDNEALGLYSIARKLPSKAVVVEIGSWQGKSTFCISKGLKSGNVYAIDPFNRDAGKDFGSQIEYNNKIFEDSLEFGFKKNMIDFKVVDKITIKKGYSYDFHNDFSEIDFLFIDGDHSIEGCKLDFDLYASKIKSGGYLAFHDYYPDRNDLGPTFVINEIVSQSDSFIFYKSYDSLWVAKKK